MPSDADGRAPSRFVDAASVRYARRMSTAFRVVGLFAAALVVALGPPGCGGGVGTDGGVVGGACTTGDDCAGGSRCLNDKDFPGGTCAVSCSRHEDCPAGSRCVEKAGGVCLLQCELPADCRGGYTCKGEKNESGGGESLVCIDD